jgi:ABC-2 type transport system ATP-binding protein
MEIVLENISKRFIKSYVIKGFSHHFTSGKVYGIQGSNGSGKSTLLKIISGAMVPSSGEVLFQVNGQSIHNDKVYNYLSYYASGDELIEEYTPREVFSYTSKFNIQDTDYQEFIEFVDLKKESDQFIDTFSSGMKQRLSLGLVLNSNKPILLFDEPVTYLDEERKEWFYKALEDLKKAKDKMIIIASNERADFSLCDEIIKI